MTTQELSAIQTHCDELTQNGQELSVAWEGGNDSGWFYLQLGGIEILELSPLQQHIVQLVQDTLGYGSFAGDYSTDGAVIYDPKGKCFVGEDSYSETDQGAKECHIELAIPEHIWFDSMTVNIQSGDAAVDTTISLQIQNGPYPEAFGQWQTETEGLLNEKFLSAVMDIDDFEGIWENFTLPRSAFQASGGMLLYKINEFSYSFSSHDQQSVYIPLTGEEAVSDDDRQD